MTQPTMIKSSRIGRQVKHFEQVDIGNITAGYSSELHRYKLTIPFLPAIIDYLPRTKNATIILKNPSSADAKKADKTIQNASKIIFTAFPDVCKLDILNLFSYRATDAKDLQDFYSLSMCKNAIGMVGHNAENTEHFKYVLSQTDYCILAWGGNSGIDNTLYDEAIRITLHFVKQCQEKALFFRKGGKGSLKHPYHACFWPNNTNFKKVEIIEEK